MPVAGHVPAEAGLADVEARRVQAESERRRVEALLAAAAATREELERVTAGAEALVAARDAADAPGAAHLDIHGGAGDDPLARREAAARGRETNGWRRDGSACTSPGASTSSSSSASSRRPISRSMKATSAS